MPKVQANGIDIYYEVKGTGEPLLLIAGFACDVSIWSLVASRLTSQFQVITFDNRGIGRSSAPDQPYTIAEMAEDASALLDHLGIPSAHVAGHSMGGQIAQTLALDHRDKVRSLMLIASGARINEHNRAIIETWGELPRLVDRRAAAQLSLPWVYTPRFYARPGAIPQVIDIILGNPFPSTPHGIFHQSRAISAFDVSNRLAEIACPTLVLAGKEDLLLPAVHSEALARAIPNAKLMILEDTGHGLLIESPEAVVEGMFAFLTRQKR
jgi:pimeloyl-ACP methyl ester carboxylesterase